MSKIVILSTLMVTGKHIVLRRYLGKNCFSITFENLKNILIVSFVWDMLLNFLVSFFVHLVAMKMHLAKTPSFAMMWKFNSI